jgi:thiosulfate dehydrogenase [quinone] large subunit
VFFILLLRIAVGWHFAFEGYQKVRGPGDWTAAGYLKNAQGPLADRFKQLAGDDSLLGFIDIGMSWGMLVIGVCFMLGLLTRTTGLLLMLMLVGFYLSAPPWTGQKLPVEEGNYLYINKNLIEFLAVAAILASGVSRSWGLDGLFRRRPVRLAGSPRISVDDGADAED